MKKYNDWWVPDSDVYTARDVLVEWENKRDYVLNLIPNKSIVAQAGGNYGIFAKYLSDYFETVYTFEPVSECWEVLVKNLKDIGNIHSYNKGLGRTESLASIAQTFQGNPGATMLQYKEEGTLSIITLDSLNLPKCDLFWLDVEGFEVEALEGARNTIAKYRPVIILENKGLIPGYNDGGLNGSTKLREYMHDSFGYKLNKRIMRDDIFISE